MAEVGRVGPTLSLYLGLGVRVGGVLGVHSSFDSWI